MIPKFRAWDKESKTMYEVKSIVYTLGSMLCVNRNALLPERTLYFEDAPVMQSTGLVDKHGQEIWEGDVVRMRSGELLPVKLHHGMFIPVCFYISSVFEREGNVFEHPELLEDPDFRED